MVAILVAARCGGPAHCRPGVAVGGALGVLPPPRPPCCGKPRNGWPALEMGTVVSDESNRWLLLPTGLFYAGVLVGLVLCCAGAVSLLRNPQLRQFRFLGWSAVRRRLLPALQRPPELPGQLVRSAVRRRGGGAANAAAAITRPRWQWLPWPAYLLSAVVPVALLPIYPLSFLAQHPNSPASRGCTKPGGRSCGTRWWRRTSSSRRDAQQDRGRGQSLRPAGLLDVYGRPAGLPRVYSPHRGYWFFGSPPNRRSTSCTSANRACWRSASQCGAARHGGVRAGQHPARSR